MLQAFLRRRVGDVVSVDTAGVLPGDRPVDDSTVTVLERLGFDVAGHRSCQLQPDAIEKADLVLCLERRHLREVLVVARSALARTFTVRELVRRAEHVGAREGGEAIDRWLARVSVGRDPARLLEDAPDDDVADPTGGPLAAYEHTAQWLDTLAGRLVALAWPPDVEAFDAIQAAGLDGLDDDLSDGAKRALAATAAHPEPELWRQRRSGTGRAEVVGLLADRPGVRLARGVESMLESMSYELFDLAGDAWVAPDWAVCAREAAKAVTDGRAEIAILLTESASGPAALVNRHRGARAVAPHDVTSARRARRRWGANVLCLGVDEVTPAQAVEILQAFLAEPAGVAPELDLQ